MKAVTHSRPRPRLVGLLSTLLTVGVLSTLGMARDGGGTDDNTMFGGGSSGGIGTVPLTAGNNANVPVPNGQSQPGGANEFKPSLRFVGTLPEIEAIYSSMYSSDGTGWWNTNELAGGKWSLEVHGNTVVELDRVAFTHSSVKVQMSVEPLFAGGAAVLKTGGGHQAVQPLASGNLNLPLHRASKSGLIDRGLNLKLKSQAGLKTSLSITAEAGMIQLELHQ